MCLTAGKTFWRVFLPLAHFLGFHFIMASASLRCPIGDSIELSRALRQTLAQSNAFSGRSTLAKQTRSRALLAHCARAVMDHGQYTPLSSMVRVFSIGTLYYPSATREPASFRTKGTIFFPPFPLFFFIIQSYSFHFQHLQHHHNG